MPGVEIEFRAASFAEGGSSPRLAALDLRIGAGETLVLLGRSGSGKTTTLKLVNALLLPSSGEVRVADRATTEWDVAALRRATGWVIQEVGLFPHRTVEENIGLVPRLLGWDTATIARRVEEMLALVNLEPARFAHRHPAELSGGERQRVGVARAIAADPPLVLMDEPFGALDPPTRRELREDLRALVARLGKTVVFVTHDLREALALGDRIALLRRGRLEFVGDPRALLESDNGEAQEFLRTLDDPRGGRWAS